MAWLECRIALAAAVLAISFVGAGAQERYGIGRLAAPAEITGWNIDIGRDGSDLPAGKGSVERGRVVFAEQCAACHGAEGQGGLGDRLVGGARSLPQSRFAPSAVTGPMRRRCSTISAAPCRRMRRNPSAMRTSTQCPPTSFISMVWCRRTRCSMRIRSPRSGCRTATRSSPIPGRT